MYISSRGQSVISAWWSEPRALVLGSVNRITVVMVRVSVY